MNASFRLTWIYPLIFGFHPFKFHIFGPIFWTVAIHVAAATPLILSAQYSFIFSRPLLAGSLGNFLALGAGYIIARRYPELFPALRFAILPSARPTMKTIKNSTVRAMNNDKALFLYFFGPMWVVTIAWFTLCFHEGLNRTVYSFFYILSDAWYVDDSKKFARLLSLWVMISASLAILCTGLWFQLLHWRMFQRLLALPLVSSPVVVYQGFSKLWITTNISSTSLLLGNFVVLFLIDFDPHPIQIIVLIIVTFPGVIGLLWPTLRLYGILSDKKELRTKELLRSADRMLLDVNGPDRTIGYANAYSAVFLERSVGNFQAAISFILAVVSLLAAFLQIAGLDTYLRLLKH